MNDFKNTIITSVIFIVVVTFMLTSYPVLAVDESGLFELDGNALQDEGSPPPDDWELLHINPAAGSQVIFTEVTPDVIGPDVNEDRIFVGGRKDIQDIDKWGWKDSGGLPDKDDLTNAYAAAYTDDSNFITYFGADRFSNVGDAFMGFWFFQDQVKALDDGTFQGHHEVNDILVLINFPQSAKASPEIRVVAWDPVGADIATNLRLVFDGAVCSTSGGEQLACATTNDGDTNSPWPYTPKSGTADVFPFESFFEGGINLTELLGGDTPCFTTFMAETRSSKRFTATLKDFVLDKFPVCGIAVSKTCDVVRLTDESDLTDKFFVVNFEGDVTNTGIGSFLPGSTLTVVDDAGTPGDESDDVVIEEILAESFDSGESIPFSGDFFSNSNPPHNTVTASIDFSESETPIKADPCSVDCNNLILDPNLSLSKLCWTRLKTVECDSNSVLAVEVFYSGEVCNTGDVPLTVTVTDVNIGVVLPPTLMDPCDCSLIEGSYLPDRAKGDVNSPCIAGFSDTFIAVGSSLVPGIEDHNEVITANCDLCDDCD
jgi:hypothetical protein